MMSSKSESDDREWFVRAGDDILGPLTTTQVRELIELGVVDETTAVRPTTRSTWRPAGKVKRLFPDVSAEPRRKSAVETNDRKRAPRTLQEIRESEARGNVKVLGALAVAAPLLVGLLFANFDLNFTIWQRIGIFLGTAFALLLITIPTFIYQCFPRYQERIGNSGKVIVETCVGLAVFALVGGFLFHVIKNRGTEYVIVDLPDRKPGEWTRYTDPKGRFHCDVPPDWTIKHAPDDPQSKVILSHDKQNIRITVRNTNHPVLNEADRKEIVDGMKKLAGGIGRDGEVVDDEWTTLAGSRALRININSTRPKVFVRAMKSKHKNWDHFVAVYVTVDGEEREAILKVFDEFLKRYDRPVKQ